MIELQFLGTGGGMPMPCRFLSSVLLNFNGRKILIDCGEGTQVSMRMLKSGFKAIDIICITHIHGDHILGLPGLLSTIGNSGRITPIIIIGPKGIKKAIEGFNPIIPYLPYEIEIMEDIREISVFNDNVVIKTMEVEHSALCIAYSFYIRRYPQFSVKKAEENKVPKSIWNKLQKGNCVNINGTIYTPSMVLGDHRKGIKISMVTDTRPIDEISNFINESQVFICEGTYGQDIDKDKAEKNKHMTFSEAANLAKKGNVEMLMLTHFSNSMMNPQDYIENASTIFENSIICNDGLKYELNFKN